MATTINVAGIWSAALTPLDEELSPDSAIAVPYYRDLLQRGCDGLNLLGTTGEAMSFSVGQRLRFIEAIATASLPMERLMVGTGAASLDDAIRLTRAAFEIGFRAALIMPPFFYRDVTHDGILAFFNALISRTNPPPQGLLLYNFPKMSGIEFTPDLVDRLLTEFPGVIGGMKDSSNNAQLQADILSRHHGFPIFPGSESGLLEAKVRGVAGCISGSVALWPQLARSVFYGGDAAQAGRLSHARAALDGFPFIPAMRYLTATLRTQPDWLRDTPPLTPLTTAQRRALDAAIQQFLVETR